VNLHRPFSFSEKVCNHASYVELSGPVRRIANHSRSFLLVGAVPAVLGVLTLSASRAEAQEAVRFAANETTDPGAAIAPEQSTDLTSELNPPLPVATNDSANPPAPATLSSNGVPRRFHYELHLNIHSVYDDNINISQGVRESDVYTAIEPSITFGFGDLTSRDGNFLSVNYLASLFLFADHSENNALQHVFQGEAQYQANRLTLNLTQSVQILDGTDIRSLDSSGNFGQQVNLDVAGRTRFNIYTTHANAAYYLTGKTFLSVGGDYTVSDYENNLISSSTISGNLFLNYNYGPKLVIGVGGTIGSNVVDSPTPDQTFEQVNARFIYQLTGKIDVHASAGIEFREFDDAGRDQHTSPVFDIELNYLPFDGTTISLTANRHTLNSAVLAGQDFVTTNFTVNVQQRMFDRVHLGLGVGYENSDYFSAVAGTSSNRTDNYFFVEPSITVRVTRFWSVGAYYLHRANDSSADVFGFHDNQVGLRTSLTF